MASSYDLSEQDRYKQASKHVKDFKGLHGNAAIQWLEDLEWHCGKDLNLARRILPRKLGSASCRGWYDSLSNIEKNQYAVLKSKFMDRFVPSSFYNELLRFLQHRKMWAKESVQTYYNTIKDVKEKLGRHCPADSVVCSYFRAGLSDEIRKRLPLHQCHENFSNLDQLLESARIIENDNMSCISGVRSSLLDGIDDRVIDCDAYLSDYEAGRSRLRKRSHSNSRKRRATALLIDIENER